MNCPRRNTAKSMEYEYKCQSPMVQAALIGRLAFLCHKNKKKYHKTISMKYKRHINNNADLICGGAGEIKIL